ncbi:conserved hypothetical protein [Histoplasma capsulatum var. duboisii H88]|uniref:Uncharacterized protein n=1 Tax=Ajellomyces capsulatus (strain H88) TaxID=544711 RepID=F0UAL0_AJEC8|nr:conserved hypothetical protein [Histoplasma capsulatum var. duboisii H88]
MRNYVPGTTLIINYDYWVMENKREKNSVSRFWGLKEMEAEMWIIPTGTSKNCGNGGIDDSEWYQNVIMVVVMPLAPYIASFDAKLAGHRGFGGGCGLGTPVVSYAPLPMFVVDKSLRIIGKIYIKLWRWSNRGLSESQPRLSKSNKGIDSRKVVRQEDKEVKPRQGILLLFLQNASSSRIMITSWPVLLLHNASRQTGTASIRVTNLS